MEGRGADGDESIWRLQIPQCEHMMQRRQLTGKGGWRQVVLHAQIMLCLSQATAAVAATRCGNCFMNFWP